MKTFKITLLAALISTPLAAETIDKTWQVGVFGEYIKSATAKETLSEWDQTEAGRGLGLELEKVIDEDWNARFELAKTRYDINDGYDTDYGTRFGLDAIYKVEDSNLYFFGGVKRFNNAQSYNAVNVGAGYNYQVNDRYSFYSEAVVYRDVNNGYTDQSFKFGLKYAFGEVKNTAVVSKAPVQEAMATPLEKAVMPVAAVTMIDTDNDGVSDKNDQCNETIANVKVDSKGCALFSEKSVEIELNVPFENNSSQVTATGMYDIQRIAEFMNEYQNTSVVIEGHSSAVGSAKYNLTISQKRADAVKNVIINEYGIAASRLSAQGFGESQLISTGNTKADHEINRRVVAKIEATVKAVVIKD